MQATCPQPDTGDEAEQARHDRRQGGQQAFRIVHLAGERVVVPHVAAEHEAVHVVGDVVPFCERTAAHEQRRPGGEDRDDRGPPRTARRVDRERHHHGEAHADALQDAGPAHAAVRQPPRGKGIDRQPEHDDPQRPPPRRIAQHVDGVAALQPRQDRQRNRDPHHEQEEWKYQVGGSTAVPGCVLQRRVDVIPAAGVVDQQHAGHGQAAQGVERGEMFVHQGVPMRAVFCARRARRALRKAVRARGRPSPPSLLS